MTDLTVVLANYNQAHLLGASVGRIEAALSPAGIRPRFVLVDDGSTDGTWAESEAIARDRPGTTLVKQPVNRGRGRAVADGIRAATTALVATLDTDLEVGPHALPPMLAALRDGGVDLVLARRNYPIPLAPSRAWELGRWCAHKGYRLVTRAAFGTALDTASGCKIVRRDRLLPVLDEVVDERWFWDTEMIILARRAGLRVVEVEALCPRKPRDKSTFAVLPEAVAHVRFVAGLRRRLGPPGP